MGDKRPIGDADRQDRQQAGLIVGGIALLVLMVLIGIFVFAPSASDVIATQFTPGVGLRQAAVIAFFVTAILFVVFAIVAGDGLIGELQFMLAGFLGSFLVCWLMIAWIF